MDPRLERILSLVIEDHIATAEPVGSQALVNEHKLDVSPATVRNWFAELEAQGMLEQPHTSAGRIPSETAYRWYVDTQLGDPSTGRREQQIFRKIADETPEMPLRAKAAAKACASTIGITAIVATGIADTYYTGLTELFRQPEFRDWSRVMTMGSVLDKLEERLATLRRTAYGSPTVLIGADCPFGSACGSVLITLPNNTLFAVLGPVRMPYREARNFLAAAAEFFT